MLGHLRDASFGHLHIAPSWKSPPGTQTSTKKSVLSKAGIAIMKDTHSHTRHCVQLYHVHPSFSSSVQIELLQKQMAKAKEETLKELQRPKSNCPQPQRRHGQTSADMQSSQCCSKDPISPPPSFFPGTPVASRSLKQSLYGPKWKASTSSAGMGDYSRSPLMLEGSPVKNLFGHTPFQIGDLTLRRRTSSELDSDSEDDLPAQRPRSASKSLPSPAISLRAETPGKLDSKQPDICSPGTQPAGTNQATVIAALELLPLETKDTPAQYHIRSAATSKSQTKKGAFSIFMAVCKALASPLGRFLLATALSGLPFLHSDCPQGVVFVA